MLKFGIAVFLFLSGTPLFGVAQEYVELGSAADLKGTKRIYLSPKVSKSDAKEIGKVLLAANLGLEIVKTYEEGEVFFLFQTTHSERTSMTGQTATVGPGLVDYHVPGTVQTIQRPATVRVHDFRTEGVILMRGKLNEKNSRFLFRKTVNRIKNDSPAKVFTLLFIEAYKQANGLK
jgi:hypothetical protein